MLVALVEIFFIGLVAGLGEGLAILITALFLIAITSMADLFKDK